MSPQMTLPLPTRRIPDETESLAPENVGEHPNTFVRAGVASSLVMPCDETAPRSVAPSRVATTKEVVAEIVRGWGEDAVDDRDLRGVHNPLPS